MTLAPDADAIIIGAGPAGMSSAIELASAGYQVIVLDMQPSPGGQIYRALEANMQAHPKMESLLSALGPTYMAGLALIERFRAMPRIDYRPDTTVWDLRADGTVGWLEGEAAGYLRAPHVILASGAMERPTPFPGWTLPGVMTAGAVQTLLKAGRLKPEGRIVLAGTGPLIFRNAAEAAGVRILEQCTMRDLAPKPAGGWRADTDAGMIEAEWAINCAGAWGSDVAARLGETLPIKVTALSMMVTARVKPFIAPVVIGIDQPLSFKQSAVGSLVVGGGILGKPCLDGDTSFTIMDRMASSAAATVAAFPVLAGVPVVRTWTGLEGAIPDGIPFIGPSCRHPGLWHVFGFCGHGFQLAPAVGEAVAQSLVSGDLDPRLAPFAVDRLPPQPPRSDEASP
jgi:glycine/D-amino acid oxidase-like deaminating enzyme